MSFWKGVVDAWRLGRKHKKIQVHVAKTVAAVPAPKYTPSQHPQHATDLNIVLEEIAQAVLDGDQTLYTGLLKTYMDLRYFEAINKDPDEYFRGYIMTHVEYAVNEELIVWMTKNG